MKEGDEWKVAFTTHHGAFEPLVMYFGLINSPGTFTTMEEQHDRVIEEVLKRIKENDLFLKGEKSL